MAAHHPAGNSSSSSMRDTADQLVAAFNAMDVPGIMALRSRDCMRYIYPESMNVPAQDPATVERSLTQLRTVFHNFRLTVRDVTEDPAQRKILLWLAVRADTAAGEYVNEYVWRLQFGELGSPSEALITEWWEFTDASMRDFFPKLQAAIRKLQEDAAAAKSTHVANPTPQSEVAAAAHALGSVEASGQGIPGMPGKADAGDGSV